MSRQAVAAYPHRRAVSLPLLCAAEWWRVFEINEASPLRHVGLPLSTGPDVALSRRMDAGGEWHDDPLIMDERYVAVRVKGRGPVVLSACSHAGIINVMHDAAAVTGSKGALGGHLPLWRAECPRAIGVPEPVSFGSPEHADAAAIAEGKGAVELVELGAALSPAPSQNCFLAGQGALCDDRASTAVAVTWTVNTGVLALQSVVSPEHASAADVLPFVLVPLLVA